MTNNNSAENIGNALRVMHVLEWKSLKYQRYPQYFEIEIFFTNHVQVIFNKKIYLNIFDDKIFRNERKLPTNIRQSIKNIWNELVVYQDAILLKIVQRALKNASNHWNYFKKEIQMDFENFY